MKKFKVIYNSLKIVTCVVLVGVLVGLLFGCKPKSLVKKASKNMNNYTINAVFCDEEKVVNATEVLEYTNRTGESLDSLCFNLYGTAFSEDAKILPYTTLNEKKCFPNGLSFGDLEILSAKVDNLDANFLVVGEDNNACKVEFGFLLEPEKTVAVELVFKLKLANCTHRLGFVDGFVNLGNWYPIVAVYENGEFNITPYYSSGDPFFSECANYDVTIVYPEKYTLSHSGEVLESVAEGGVETVKLNAKAVRDFALNLSDNYKTAEGSVGHTKVRVLTASEDENISKYLEVSLKAVTLFNKLFGDYPYETLDVAFTPFLHGGMEYPNLVYIANDITDFNTIVKVIVHEIAHQWWYGVVGNNEITDAWFDESLAEYSSVLYFENFPEYGITREDLVDECVQDYNLYLDVITSVNLKHNLSMQLPLQNYLSEYEYVYMVYVKGTIFIDELRNTLGDEDFFEGLQNLYKDNMFKIITKVEFVEAFNKASGVDVTALVEGFLSGNTEVRAS